MSFTNRPLVQAVSLGAGSAITVANSKANPVGVSQAVNGVDFWSWPCVAGESYSPTFSTSTTYARVAGCNCVKVSGGYAGWNAGASGPDPARGILVADFRFQRQNTAAGAGIGWTSVNAYNSATYDGVLLAVTSTVIKYPNLSTGADVTAPYPAAAGAPLSIVTAQLRVDFAAQLWRFLVAGVDIFGAVPFQAPTADGARLAVTNSGTGALAFVVAGPISVTYEKAL